MSDVEAEESTLSRGVVRYSISLLAVIVAFLLRRALAQYLGLELPAFIFFYPTVMIVALLAGLGAGLTATVFASLLADYWIFQPIGHFEIADKSDAIAMIVFCAMGIFLSVVAERFRAYQRQIVAMERKAALQRTEEALHESEERLRSILENMSEGLMIFDTHRKMIYQNTASLRLHGFESPERGPIEGELPKATWKGWDEKGRPLPDDEWPKSRVFRDGPFQNQILHVQQIETGYEFDASYNGCPLYDSTGNITAGFITIRDITEERKADQDLRRQAELLRLSFDAIIVWRLDGGIESWNRGAEQLYGFSENEAVGRIVHELLRAVLPRPWPEIETKLREQGFWEGELRHYTKDGRELTVLARKQLIHSEDGVQRIVESNRDITERKRAEESLREREALLQEMGRMAKVGGWEFNPATGHGSWTEQVAHIHDVESEVEVTPELGKSFYSGKSRTLIENAFRNALGQAKPYDLELEFISAKGIHKWVRTTGQPVLENGKVVKMRGSFQDITDRKEADSKLRTTLERFYAILSNMYSGILLVTNEGRIEFANQALCDRFGVEDTPDDLIGLAQGEMLEKIRNSYHLPEDALARVSEIVKAGLPVIGEELTMQNGRTFLRDFVPITIDGKPYGRLWLHVDITERKRAERALQASEDRWVTTLRSIGDAVISTDAAGSILFMNDVAQQLTGWSLEEAAGKELDVVFDIVQEVTRVKPESPVSKVLRLGHVVGLANHTALIRRDGTEIPIEDSGAPVRGRDGQIDGVVLVFHDVSEQRAIEKALRNSERLATTGRLAATIAHEIHNPLDTIGGLLHLVNGYAGRRYPRIGDDGRAGNRSYYSDDAPDAVVPARSFKAHPGSNWTGPWERGWFV
jgi:PAS domain S-box-containing protein